MAKILRFLWLAGLVFSFPPAQGDVFQTGAASTQGPVVMPAQNATAPPPDAAPAEASAAAPPNAGPNVPRDPDGGPAKVFMVITPATTDAYVGENVMMEIDFFIRMSVNADQDSLPTIKGSNFLMNSSTARGAISTVLVEDQEYMRESWMTAISAPKSGDFPLSMERDTYWQKTTADAETNPFFGSVFDRKPDLAHDMIGSNLLTMHVHPLPEEGRPDGFTGAVGQFHVTSEAGPVMVSVGEPVQLRFTVSGVGNFDYVRAPRLATDPAWKAYTPLARSNFGNDPSRMQGFKVFDQSIIPQKSGNLPLPDASFCYFDPTQKRYVTVPLGLPVVTVTGSAAPVADADGAEAPPAMATQNEETNFLPNRANAGWTQSSMTPVFRQPWFWAVQAGLLALPITAAAFLLTRLGGKSRGDETTGALRRSSLQQEESAMTEARRKGDALAFFVAARHAVQLQLGDRWSLPPEAITLGGIRARDPHLAETLAPLFLQADEVIYAGHSPSGIDLAAWEQRVKIELLSSQPT